MNNIPAGYQLHITTWENDGDAYNTKIVSGLGLDDVTFLVALAKKFKSCHNHIESGLGNGGTTRNQLVNAIESAMSEHMPNKKLQDEINGFITIQDENDEDDNNGYYIYEWLVETILGYPVEELYRYDYERFCRVFDSFNVFYYQTEVKNVTENF